MMPNTTHRWCCAAIFVLFQVAVYAQTQHTGVVFDANSKEPLQGAIIKGLGTQVSAITDALGYYSVTLPQSDTLAVTYTGYRTAYLPASQLNQIPVPGGPDYQTVAVRHSIALQPVEQHLQAVVITANREAALRQQAPMAIGKITPKLIEDTRPATLHELLNKVPGVVMTNLNNEQHSLSVRQPMSLNAYFLYLEDGIPIRPLGVFSNNALIETNLLAVSSIEVIKGPASSLYGPEAAGGAVNLITQRPTAVRRVQVGVQGDNWGYRRVQYSLGGMLGKKWGLQGSGYVARQRKGWQDHSDMDKVSFNGHVAYHFNSHTRLYSTVAYHNYDSQTGGTVDSVAFYSKNYPASNNFAYRKTYAFRARTTFERDWKQGQTVLTGYVRDNSLRQSPAFSIRWRPNQSTAIGENNDNSFRSRGIVLQHTQRFGFLRSRLLAGVSHEASPHTFYAYRILLAAQLRPGGNSVEQFSLVAEQPDSFLVNYKALIQNTAAYAQWDALLLPRLRLSVGGRFDRMGFDFENFLDGQTGTRTFQQFTPKVGLTYSLKTDIGVYANWSQGFAPPSLSAIFRRRPVPDTDGSLFYYNLKPAVFNNAEVGGWAAFWQQKIYVDWAVYRLTGRNELLNIRLPDNSFDYQSAGRTLHQGIELGVSAKPHSAWLLRWGGTYALHRFDEFQLSFKEDDAIKNANGKIMPNAPAWIYNAEVFYFPPWLKGFRTALEWQRLSSWYQNQINTVRYEDRTALGLRGYSVLNLRIGYQWRFLEVFTNVLNLSNELYANNVTRGNNPTDRASFTQGAPRTVSVGLMMNW
jgi:iron complex outermembrane recepter protein